jgi:hypothetical protein
LFFRTCGWTVNENNRFVRKVANEKKDIEKKLGKVGVLSEDVKVNYYLYKLVVDRIITFADLDTMTLFDLDCLMAIYDMKQDYKSVMNAYEEERMEKERRK